MKQVAVFVFAALCSGPVTGAEVSFMDEFRGGLKEGWRWIREDRAAWRATDRGLEVHVQPGNMWGAGNNARNVLVRSLPAIATNGVALTVTVTNQPTGQYEQVDLVWYYDDSHMVKLGQELVDGKLSIVMGREQADRARTIAIIPLDSFTVTLRLTVRDGLIHGEFRMPKDAAWREAGECDLPVKGAPNASLQFYQGPAEVAHWARVTDFRIEVLP